MTTALYRRYRPESFGEMIGQSQVTEPLMTALRGDRVGHAYLFSGPRGCGKTTSARILARCLNCAEGPTDTPCGTCESCVELSRAGGGSLDVVEIDAASHNGVDDARDLRERATFAPSRDRYKIFILDEAHMVTPQGFNALLKLVEEPPPHVKFIFATTEPEKVLGTIRSRTHHYPFRLVPPAAMLEYVEKLCAEEGVVVEKGVLPLVVRAGGGSPRDTLSLLDQLIAGSDSPAGSETVTVAYERAVALLGYTHATLLDEIVDALAAGDAAAAFPAIDRVVQTGQDPRRFVDDLLERLRDLIVIAAVGSGASAVLRGIAEDELARMRSQAEAFGSARLSRTADVVSAALDDMSGATSPRLHLELMVARVLAGPSDAGATAGAAAAAQPRAAAAPAPRASAPAPVAASAADAPASAATATPSARPAAASATETPAPVQAADAPAQPGRSPAAPATVERESDAADTANYSPAEQPAPAPSGPVTFERITSSWSAVLKRLEDISRSSWLLATAVQPLAYVTETDVLTLGFTSQHDVAKFKGTTPGSGPSDHLRTAIEQELGVRVKYVPAPMPQGGAPRQPSSSGGPTSSGSSTAGASASEPASAGSTRTRTRSDSAAPVTEWAVAPIPASAPSEPAATATLTDHPAGAPGTAAAASSVAAPRPAPAAAADTAQSASAAPTVTGHPVPSDDAPPPNDDEPPPYDDEPPYDPSYEPTPPRAPSRPSPQSSAATATSQATPAPPSAPASAPVVTERTPSGGVQRYGEAVIRQVLGATFVREEPYEPPTRFS
ncbi:DNA polymerase III subunit gamma and tau [Microbacterium hydrocarbonoxydans]|uniref:DNA polymerase III subunit gamma and tau n=1 Tax=Microbacterium hydrocarbonoxydans TaxID=273678 RepID=UPI00203E67C1|nr:DNA polymerase III subunit gamma and tau [Microbacterium hydrocarbonoxydans]MCM3779999.1 DNA polymerase III subunit gamma and tau [Microbacterium hydrocarbonoxydans]